MATITYNDVELPQQLRKLFISRTSKTLEFSSVHAVAPEDFKQFCEDFTVDDAPLTIESGAYTERFLLNDDDGGAATPVTGVEAFVERLSERSDGEKMWLVRFTLRAKLQATGNGVIDYNISWTQNDQGIYVLTITGEMSGMGSASALTTFETEISTIQEFAKELLGDLSDGDLDNTFFDEPSTFIELDKNTGQLRFSRSFNELADPANQYTGAEVRDSTIVFPVWGVTRVKTLRRGIDVPHLTQYLVRWQARLNKDKAQGSFISQYDGAIRALIVKRIKEIFSESDTLVLESDDIEYGRTGQTASGSWAVTSNQEMVQYRETLRANVVVAESDKVLDNKDFTEAPYSPGARLEVTQTVVHIQRGTPPSVPPAPLVSFNGEALQMFLKEFTPEESSEIVGAETGGSGQLTGVATEYTLNWSAVYRAYAGPAADDFKKTIAGGRNMNVQGKIIHPNAGGQQAPAGPSGSGQ